MQNQVTSGHLKFLDSHNGTSGNTFPFRLIDWNFLPKTRITSNQPMKFTAICKHRTQSSLLPLQCTTIPLKKSLSSRQDTDLINCIPKSPALQYRPRNIPHPLHCSTVLCSIMMHPPCICGNNDIRQLLLHPSCSPELHREQMGALMKASLMTGSNAKE